MASAADPLDAVAIATASSSPSLAFERTDVFAVADSLGWTLRLEAPLGGTFVSTLPLRIKRANIALEGDLVIEVQLGLTDPIDEEDAAALTELLDQQREFVEIFSSEFGDPAGTTSAPPATFWDPAEGRRITLCRVGDRLQLAVLGEGLAQLERDEARLGIDPNRDPFAPADHL